MSDRTRISLMPKDGGDQHEFVDNNGRELVVLPADLFETLCAEVDRLTALILQREPRRTAEEWALSLLPTPFRIPE